MPVGDVWEVRHKQTIYDLAFETRFFAKTVYDGNPAIPEAHELAVAAAFHFLNAWQYTATQFWTHRGCRVRQIEVDTPFVIRHEIPWEEFGSSQGGVNDNAIPPCSPVIIRMQPAHPEKRRPSWFHWAGLGRGGIEAGRIKGNTIDSLTVGALKQFAGNISGAAAGVSGAWVYGQVTRHLLVPLRKFTPFIAYAVRPALGTMERRIMSNLKEDHFP
jgi:hypothetical protein